MKKFEGILLCTDLDGTLLRNDKSISRENLDAINYFMSEGGYFTFITGRMPYTSSNIYKTRRFRRIQARTSNALRCRRIP